jgi:ribosomal-protein-alanine N-acetyltransferase
MKEIVIAQKDHLHAISELEKITFFEPWSEKALELFIEAPNFCVACLKSDELASYCTVTTILDEAQIINVATNTVFKRMGYAKEVLERVFSECKERNIKLISLEVRESNIPAINLYENLGFTIAGKRKDFYKNPRENAFVMIKNLD